MAVVPPACHNQLQVITQVNNHPTCLLETTISALEVFLKTIYSHFTYLLTYNQAHDIKVVANFVTFIGFLKTGRFHLQADLPP